MLHLGAIDESLVRTQDFYLCLRSIAADVPAKLYACWRTSIIEPSSTTTTTDREIIYHQLDPDTDSLTPLSIEMLAGEDLPQLLQSLLVGVERAICRVPLDELTFPHCPLLSAESSAIDYSPPSSDNLSSNKRLECNLKRRDLITKNNCISNKYALKRALSSHSTNSSKSNNISNETAKQIITNECEILNINHGCESIDGTTNTTSSSNESNAMTTSTNTSMPLFCLGGSFPHIDSDEESGDEIKNIENGKKFFII